MTLAPSCPTAAWSVPPGIAAGLPLLGFSKDRPSIGAVGESTPGRAFPPGLRDEATSPVRVPPSWFLTTSTVCSSSTSRACCIPLPILGFTAFQPVAKRTSSRCFPALRSLDPRRQRLLRTRLGRGFPRPARARSRGTASPPVLLRAGAFTASPCPPDLPLSGRHVGCPPRVSGEPGLQGLAPPSGPEPATPFPAPRARCSHGLGRCPRRLPPPRGFGKRASRPAEADREHPTTRGWRSGRRGSRAPLSRGPGYAAARARTSARTSKITRE